MENELIKIITDEEGKRLVSARELHKFLEITDRFQLVINGVEIVNGYSELVDPVEQEKRLHEQAMNKAIKLVVKYKHSTRK